MLEHFLFTEKYRPKTINECILPSNIKNTFNDYISKGELPNFLLSGSPGQGKTCCSRALCSETNAEVLFINGSEETGIDVLRNKIRSFASSMSLTDAKKIVIIDESEYLSSSAQPGLRAFMEEFALNCRFILTCNYKHRIIAPIHSRCQVIDFVIPKEEVGALKTQFLKRIISILSAEGITYDIKSIAKLIEGYFPDYRRILNEIQRYSVSGHIDSGILLNLSSETYKALFKILKEKRFTDARKWVKANNDVDVNKIFLELYENADGNLVPESVPVLVTLIARYQYETVFVAHPEINLLSLLTDIMRECSFI